MPVVVYVDGGDDLDSEAEEKLQPSAALAKSQSVVFVKVNYRYPHTINTIGMSGIIPYFKYDRNREGRGPKK